MKDPTRLAVLLAALLAIPPMSTRADTAEAGHVDFGKLSGASGSEFVEVSIKSNLISMATRLAEKSEPQVAEVLRGLKEIRVNVIGLTDENRGDMQQRIEKIKGQLDGNGWEPIVTAQKKDGDVRVFLKMKNDESVQGLVITIMQGKKEAVLINIVGDIQPEKVALLGERFDIEPLKNLGPLAKKHK